MKSRREPTNLSHAPTGLHAPIIALGVDGGGTKTLAIITDEEGRTLGEGLAGPSNPLRVGVSNAAAAVREAVDRACASADVRLTDIASAEIGLAGVRRADLKEHMTVALKRALGIGTLSVVTDADIALYGATGGKPGLVLIAGTGSICCGKNARRKHVCVGGWGPLAGDEGSGSWIARRALQAVAQATDGRGKATSLGEAACQYFNVATPDDLSLAIYAANMTNERIAGFARHVIEAAFERDPVAGAIITDAGHELAAAACTVIRKLHIERESFQVAYVGGVFSARELVLAPLQTGIKRVAPRAFLAPPQLSPAVAAATMAREQIRRLALAG
ncbi:MAG TPA: BadF/BadG/BcrA/BcrD ATPase family protein [Pyrinomonadaceae bacterium]|jgi:N-acetylglucosamine kinase-like BadF-type ATPase|nr:BadF/BadG/BcrA/BcrD ATPase family protein [Pyrinomonadaceae bacterium]